MERARNREMEAALKDNLSLEEIGRRLYVRSKLQFEEKKNVF
jgi:hypothetical protein